MTVLTERNRISIATICFYSPTLVAALYLVARHGPGRSAAWLFLIIFSLFRLTGSALQLVTIRQPFSIPINVAALVLQNVGISPLMLMALSLCNYVLADVRRCCRFPVVLRPIYLRGVQLLVLLGLILGVVGGVKAGNVFSNTGHFQMQVEGEVGLGLICGGYGLLVPAAGAITWYSRKAAYEAATVAEEDVVEASVERRKLLLASWLSLPFILVRLVYGCLATFTTDSRFNQLVGDANFFLGMAVIMEMCVVVICAGVGLSLRSIPWEEQKREAKKMVQEVVDMFSKRHGLCGRRKHEPALDEKRNRSADGSEETA